MYRVFVSTAVRTAEDVLNLGYEFTVRTSCDREELNKCLYLYDIGLFEGHYRLKMIEDAKKADNSNPMGKDIVAGFIAFQKLLKEMHEVDHPCMKIVRVLPVPTHGFSLEMPIIFRLHNDPRPIQFGMKHCQLCLRVEPCDDKDRVERFYCIECSQR